MKGNSRRTKSLRDVDEQDSKLGMPGIQNAAENVQKVIELLDQLDLRSLTSLERC